MKNPLLRTLNSLKAITKQFAVVLVTIVMLLNLTQTAGMVASSPETQAPLGVPNTEEIPDQDYNLAKEKRQEWQRKASAVRQEQENKPTTLGEKLNVNELDKGYDPARETEKRSVPTP